MSPRRTTPRRWSFRRRWQNTLHEARIGGAVVAEGVRWRRRDADPAGDLLRGDGARQGAGAGEHPRARHGWPRGHNSRHRRTEGALAREHPLRRGEDALEPAPSVRRCRELSPRGSPRMFAGAGACARHLLGEDRLLDHAAPVLPSATTAVRARAACLRRRNSKRLSIILRGPGVVLFQPRAQFVPEPLLGLVSEIILDPLNQRASAPRAPASSIVTRPVSLSERSSSCTRRDRAPRARPSPSGWPRAIAPPVDTIHVRLQLAPPGRDHGGERLQLDLDPARCRSISLVVALEPLRVARGSGRSA